MASAITAGNNRVRLAAEMWECQRPRRWGQHSTFWRLRSALRRLEPGLLSKGYTSRTACLPQTIRAEGGCFFLFFISTVGCQSQLVDPPPQKRLCVREPRPPLGAAGPGVRSMGLNGSQRGMKGSGGSFAPASSREKKPRGKLPHPLSPGGTLSSALHLDSPPFILKLCK